MKVRASIFLSLLVFAATSYSQETSTWQTIQQQILDRQCVSCHTEGLYLPGNPGWC